MKHLSVVFMFAILVCSVQAEEGFLKKVFKDLKNQFSTEKKSVTQPVVCEKPVQPVEQQNSDMSLSEIIAKTSFDCEKPLSQIILARFNGLKSVVAPVKAGTKILIPSCDQADSIRAVMAQEKKKRQGVRTATVKDNVRVAYPTMADDGYFHWRYANADPYDPENQISLGVTLSLLSIPQEVKDLFLIAYEIGNYSSGKIEFGSKWEEMLSSKGHVCKGPNGLLAEVGSDKAGYAALIYTVEWNGNVYELADPFVCHNWMWRVVPKPSYPPEIEITFPEPEPIPEPVPKDSVPEEVVIPPPPESDLCKSRFDSYSWGGITTPVNNGVEGMQYFNSFIGADFHYYFCRKSFSEPHVGIGGALNGWYGRGFPKVGYGGLQPDVGLRFVFPWNGGAFTIGPYLGLSWAKVIADDQYGRYESRQTTFPLLIERMGLDLYGSKAEFNWYVGATQGLRGYKLSSFDQSNLTSAQDPASTLSFIGTGMKLFFGSSVEVKETEIDMGNGVLIPQTVTIPVKYRFGLFAEFNTTFEGVLNHDLDEDPAYAVGFGPSFQFPKAKWIISPKVVYLWHFKAESKNGFTIGVQIDKEIVRKFWLPGGHE